MLSRFPWGKLKDLNMWKKAFSLSHLIFKNSKMSPTNLFQMIILNADLYYLTSSASSIGICLNTLKEDCGVWLWICPLFWDCFILIMNLLCPHPLPQFTLWRDVYQWAHRWDQEPQGLNPAATQNFENSCPHSNWFLFRRPSPSEGAQEPGFLPQDMVCVNVLLFHNRTRKWVLTMQQARVLPSGICKAHDIKFAWF